ncbi:hypothetical protein KKF91_09315 [Myxococcota bacterium]|nr:hypothetical protein [Myxococcota bacterium]
MRHAYLLLLALSLPACDDGEEAPNVPLDLSADLGGEPIDAGGEGIDAGGEGIDAGGEGIDAGGEAGLAIAGAWHDGFMPHDITAEAWRMGEGADISVFHIEVIDEVGEHLVALGDANNAWNPGLYSRFDWAWEGEALYYCQIIFDAETLEAARAASGADRADLMGAGCGGFPWSALTPR